MKPETTDPLQYRIRQALDESADNLDAATRSRLRQARQQALQQPAGWRQLVAGWYNRLQTVATSVLLPVKAIGALAGVTLLALWLVFWRQDELPVWPPTSGELETMVTSADLELYQQLDFYLWLEQNRKEGSSGDST